MSHSIDGHELAAGSGVMHPSGLHRLLHLLWFAPVHGALVKAVAPVTGERIIDAGAGTGTLSGRLVTSGATVICLEPDHASLEQARQRLAGQSVEFVEAPAEHIPLDDASVDAAVASVTAHHWSDQQAGFAELARVIRPHGRLVIAEFRAAGPILRPIRRLVGSKHYGAVGLDAWRSKLEAAGFHDITIYPAGWARLLALFIVARR
jgi:ubiquinone/menaquinone biosynthesis C-methylase UbiE